MSAIRIAAPLIMMLILCPSTSANDKPDVMKDDLKATVVLLHGLGRSKTSMWLLATRLEDAGFKVHRIDYDSLNRSPEDIISDVTKQIAACCSTDSTKVHFVGHSLGGLIIRAYLNRHQVENMGRVVLIGTPNHGTPIVDRYRSQRWMKWFGPTAETMGTEENSFPKTLSDPYYPVGVIAGRSKSPLAETLIEGDNDGLVPVESTKLKGMTDFVIIETCHAQMRYNADVAKQTIAFLKYGRFIK